MKKSTREQDKENSMENQIWIIHFADGTIASCWGTYDGAAMIADLRKDLYGDSYTIEGR